jgi:hypothetical protein
VFDQGQRGTVKTSPEEPTAQTLFGASATTPLNAEEAPTFGLGTLCQFVPLKWATKVLAWALERPEEPTAQTSLVASEEAAPERNTRHLGGREWESRLFRPSVRTDCPQYH